MPNCPVDRTEQLRLIAVLNTSFNENEPIVHRLEEAVDYCLHTDMDVLAMGPWLVRKSGDGSQK